MKYFILRVQLVSANGNPLPQLEGVLVRTNTDYPPKYGELQNYLTGKVRLQKGFDGYTVRIIDSYDATEDSVAVQTLHADVATARFKEMFTYKVKGHNEPVEIAGTGKFEES